MQLMNVPLPDTILSCRIYDLDEDINDQLIDKLKDKHFFLQLDEVSINNNYGHSISCVSLLMVAFFMKVFFFAEKLYFKLEQLTGSKCLIFHDRK